MPVHNIVTEWYDRVRLKKNKNGRTNHFDRKDENHIQ